MGLIRVLELEETELVVLFLVVLLAGISVARWDAVVAICLFMEIPEEPKDSGLVLIGGFMVEEEEEAPEEVMLEVPELEELQGVATEQVGGGVYWESVKERGVVTKW